MKRAILSAILSVTATVGIAAEPDAAMQAFFDANIKPWASNAVIAEAIAAQNSQTSGYDAAQVTALDETWRSEVGMGQSELINGVVMNPAADFLRAQIEASNGVVTEVFIMDAQGLNVAASAPTSDYWQGDEAKFQQTFDVGPSAIHVSEIEFDESSQTYQAQISMTITDATTGEPIGAMTVGIDAEVLM